MMLKKIVKNQVIYEINWAEVFQHSIYPYLKEKYNLELPNETRVRVTSKASAMVKPDFIQFKLPETLLEE
jgi:hypothetical protein